MYKFIYIFAGTEAYLCGVGWVPGPNGWGNCWGLSRFTYILGPASIGAFVSPRGAGFGGAQVT